LKTPVGIASIRIHFRINRSKKWQHVEVTSLPAGIVAKTLTIPGRNMTRRGIQFYCEISAKDQQKILRGSAEHPIHVRVHKKRKIPIGGM